MKILFSMVSSGMPLIGSFVKIRHLFM